MPSVLLVIEDAALGAALERSLRSEGLEPFLTRGAADAQTWLDKNSPALVVVSQFLSGADGVAWAKKLKESRAKIPVILLAAVSGAAVGHVRKASGADAVLAHGMTAESFLAEVRRLAMPSDAKAAPRARAAARDGGVRETTREIATGSPAPKPVSQTSGEEVEIEPAWLYGQAVTERVTGVLRLVHDGVERAVWFDGGRPISADSSVGEEKIGPIAVSRGLLAQSEADRFEAFAKKNGMRLLDVLKKNGVVTAAEQESLLGEQYRERIVGAFAWSRAFLEFSAEGVKPDYSAATLPIAPILVEGLRRHYDEPRVFACVMRVIGSVEAIPRRAPHADALIVTLGLDSSERGAFVLIDGKRPVSAILAKTPSPVSALRAIYAGLALRLVGI